jgi:hypothetical protein
LKKKNLPYIKVNDLNDCWIVKIEMRSWLMRNKKRKEGKITRSKVMDIDKVCFVRNAIMKVI